MGVVGGTLGCRTRLNVPGAAAAVAQNEAQMQLVRGGIVRGDVSRRALALVFTGHEFAEGATTILTELEKRQARASFFLTGAFVARQEFQPLVRRIAAAGHYFSVHSDQHLLYCAWDRERTTLVSRAELTADLRANARRFRQLGLTPGPFFIPPYEHYNEEIVAWARAAGFQLVNYTPGTRSHADYTLEAAANFTSSQVIFDSIVRREASDPNGLNGFLLLLHLGSGPGRADKFHPYFGALLDHLLARGYELVRVDELLTSQKP